MGKGGGGGGLMHALHNFLGYCISMMQQLDLRPWVFVYVCHQLDLRASSVFTCLKMHPLKQKFGKQVAWPVMWLLPTWRLFAKLFRRGHAMTIPTSKLRFLVFKLFGDLRAVSASSPLSHACSAADAACLEIFAAWHSIQEAAWLPVGFWQSDLLQRHPYRKRGV